MQADEHPEVMQEQMDTLSARYAELEAASIINKYGYTPARPTMLALITSMFLHGGWLHLIGNMWFLWLAGAVLEDTWGRIIYPIFYMVAGVLAGLVHGMSDPGSIVPAIGASGAIAGVLGAYILMFPQSRVNVLLGTQIVAMPALIVIGFWIALQLFSEIGTFANTSEGGGVAYMAHIGGFLAGFLLTFLFRSAIAP